MYRTAIRPCLFVLAIVSVSGLHAQTQAPSMPVPTPVPASSIQSMPAVDAPLPIPPSTRQQSTEPYKDPLEQPLPLQPAPTQPAATTSAPVPPVPAVATPPAPPLPESPAPPPPPYTDLSAPLIQPTATPTPGYIPTPSPVTINRVGTTLLPSEPAYDFEEDLPAEHTDSLGSTYIPIDSPIYPLALRLYSLGYLDTINIELRPWTRRSLLHALQKTATDITTGGSEQAQMIYARLMDLLSAETPAKDFARGRVFGVDSVYTRLMGISGTPLRDSYHLGQTLVNDYGRPYAGGFNSILGFSSINEMGRFSLYVRGEYQHAPSSAGYSLALANTLAATEEDFPLKLNQLPDTIPYGRNVAAMNPFRLQEATLSFHLLGHEISAGKSDAWIGAGYGGGMAWSNNAENIYSFRINRIEPMYIPYVSKLLGPLRYDFFVGSLKGHTHPNDPWVHAETLSFQPTANFQFGFERTVIWGGKAHEAINLHTFLKSFFDINDTTFAEKLSGDDPGARFSTFNFSWRLPYLRKYVTLYTDSIVHDDVTPPSAPRRAAYRPGLFFSQLPYLPKVDFRVEAASTDTSTLRSISGQFNYYEGIQVEGYTNKGFIMGDWIGREAKGGQAWLTYHLSADEWVQLSYLNKKTPKDFVPQGTTQNQIKVDFVKHLPYGILMDAWVQYERWKAPIYLTGQQSDTAAAVQLTWYPKLHTTPKPVR